VLRGIDSWGTVCSICAVPVLQLGHAVERVVSRALGEDFPLKYTVWRIFRPMDDRIGISAGELTRYYEQITFEIEEFISDQAAGIVVPVNLTAQVARLGCFYICETFAVDK